MHMHFPHSFVYRSLGEISMKVSQIQNREFYAECVSVHCCDLNYFL